MSKKLLSRKEIVERFKDYFGIGTNAELARFLEIERQHVNQFEGAQSHNISTKMLSKLCNELV